MASGPKLDGAGTAKMQTLETALGHLQRLHTVVERMGVAVKAHQDTAGFGSQIRRIGPSLQGLLKPQFGMIADQVAALNLVASRSGSDQVRLRSLREAVAQIRTQLEIAAARTKEKHAVED